MSASHKHALTGGDRAPINPRHRYLVDQIPDCFEAFLGLVNAHSQPINNTLAITMAFGMFSFLVGPHVEEGQPDPYDYIDLTIDTALLNHLAAFTANASIAMLDRAIRDPTPADHFRPGATSWEGRGYHAPLPLIPYQVPPPPEEIPGTPIFTSTRTLVNEGLALAAQQRWTYYQTLEACWSLAISALMVCATPPVILPNAAIQAKTRELIAHGPSFTGAVLNEYTALLMDAEEHRLT